MPVSEEFLIQYHKLQEKLATCFPIVDEAPPSPPPQDSSIEKDRQPGSSYTAGSSIPFKSLPIIQSIPNQFLYDIYTLCNAIGEGLTADNPLDGHTDLHFVHNPFTIDLIRNFGLESKLLTTSKRLYYLHKTLTKTS